MERTGNVKVGVYVDVSNIAQNGGYGMQYDVLREYACRNNGVAIRLNAYVAFDDEMARRNTEYRLKSESFHSVLRDFGYKVIPFRKAESYTLPSGDRDGSGGRHKILSYIHAHESALYFSVDSTPYMKFGAHVLSPL